MAQPHRSGRSESSRGVAEPIECRTNVGGAQLQRLLRGAACLVAPALLEDYGLTVIEALQHGVPVVVCHDGGRLTHFVDDGVNGLVVEPLGSAIADTVVSIVNDPVRASNECPRSTGVVGSDGPVRCESSTNTIEETMS